MNRNLLEYSMCFTYIFWLGNFALVLHLYLFRSWRWFYFIEIDELSYLTYTILRAFRTAWQFALIIKLVLI